MLDATELLTRMDQVMPHVKWREAPQIGRPELHVCGRMPSDDTVWVCYLPGGPVRVSVMVGSKLLDFVGDNLNEQLLLASARAGCLGSFDRALDERSVMVAQRLSLKFECEFMPADWSFRRFDTSAEEVLSMANIDGDPDDQDWPGEERKELAKRLVWQAMRIWREPLITYLWNRR